EADGDLRIRRVNPGASALLGYAEAELRDRVWTDLVHRDDLSAATEHFALLSQREYNTDAFEVRCIGNAGLVVDVLANVHARGRDERGKPGTYVAFIMDISRRKKAE